jgi:dipeptidyl aminopeptidase/acylaminoacyl peptidase
MKNKSTMFTRSGRFGNRVRPWLIATAWVLGGALSAASAEEVFTPDHVAKIRSVGAVEISPDGRQIAYTLSVPRKPGKDDDGPTWTELHVIRPDGTSAPFITGEVNVGGVKWTPDGKSISFTAKRGEDKERSLYVIPIDGGEARKVLGHESGIGDYDWHPDGLRVAFLAKEKDPDKKEKEKLEKKGFKAEIYEEDLRNTRLYVGTIDDEEAEPKEFDLPGSASEIHYSPDGKSLVVALAPSPLIDDFYMKRKIHVVDAETGQIKSKIENPGKLGPIAWSPDGKNLAFIGAETIHDPGEGRLMIVPASGGPMRDVLPGFEGHVESIAWQNSETVMYFAAEGVWTTFNEVRIDGTQKKSHIPTGRSVLGRLSLSQDGQSAALVGNSPRHPNEVFGMRHGNEAPIRLTDSNPWLAEMRFAEQRPVRFKARDGLEIEGILIEPLDRQSGKRYPLIVTVHGGPEAHDSNGWLTGYSDPGQVAAAKGMAVLYPNYRGSTGRGVKFSMLDQADYAGPEFDDLVDGVDYLVEAGLVDKARVGVTGGSYGGFATAWCSTYHSERFAAGVMFVGISNHVSKSGTTDIPNEMTLVHARKRLWEDWDFFLERSPIRHVEKARTPLLILHGKDDTRVHPSQSMELYRHIKVLGKTPVRLVWYPGEGHGNRKAAARYDYNLRMLRWFEHYLISPGGDPPPHELDYGLGDDEKEASEKDDG